MSGLLYPRTESPRYGGPPRWEGYGRGLLSLRHYRFPPSMPIIYWLRNDLRQHDNAVLAALPAATEALLPVYCFDPAYFGPDAYLGLPKVGPHRMAFCWPRWLICRLATRRWARMCIL